MTSEQEQQMAALMKVIADTLGFIELRLAEIRTELKAARICKGCDVAS